MYDHHHHHTVQVAMRAYSFVCTLANALVLQENTPPAQVAAGDDDHDCKWSIFASGWKEKHHQHKLYSVKTILGTSIGAGRSNQMELAQGHHLNADLIYICTYCTWQRMESKGLSLWCADYIDIAVMVAASPSLNSAK